MLQNNYYVILQHQYSFTYILTTFRIVIDTQTCTLSKYKLYETKGD